MVDRLARLGLEVDSSGVVRATSSMREMERQGGRVEDRTQRVGQTARRGFGIMRTAIIGATAALGGLSFGRVIRETANFEQSMAGLRAVSGATDEQFASLEQQARQLGATSIFSAQQAAEAQRFLAQAGFEVNEVLASTPGLLNLATAAQLELGEAADIASNVLSGFRLEVEELNRVNDVLANTAASANTDVQQLGQALSFAAPIAASAGVSIEETAAAIGALSDAGVQSGRAGRGFTAFIRQVSNITPQAAEALERYGIAIEDVDVSTRGLQPVIETLRDANLSTADSFEIFGSQAATVSGILTASADNVDRLTSANRDAEGSLDDMAAILGDTLQASLRGLNSALSESVLQIGESTGAFRSLVDAATGVLAAYNGMLPQLAEANGLTDEQVGNIERIVSGLNLLGQAATAVAAVIATRFVVSVTSATAAMIRANAAAVTLRSTLLLFGGPAGVAILAAGALYTLSQRQTEAERTTATLRAEMDGLTQSTQNLTRAQIENQRVNLEMRLAEELQKRDELAARLASETALLDQGVEMRQRANSAIAKTTAELEQQEEQVGILFDALSDLNFTLQDLSAQESAAASSGATLNGVLNGQINAAMGAASAMGLLSDSVDDVQESVDDVDFSRLLTERDRIQAELAGGVMVDMFAAESQLRRRFDTLNELRAEDLISEREYQDLRQDAIAEREAAITDIVEREEERRARMAEEANQGWLDGVSGAFTEFVEANRQALSITANTLGGFADLYRQAADQGGEGAEKQFEIWKAMASAQAAVSTALAVANALTAAPPPFNFALATAVGALGGAQIATIQGQEYQAPRRQGGQVRAGNQYLVGEEGPELLDMRNATAGGNITRNGEFGGSSNTMSVTNVFQLSGDSTGAMRAEVMRLSPMIAQMSKQSVEQAISEGGSMSRQVRRRS